ncbi:restriction endonuclease subunit S [Methylomonas sp. HW2-6]|uniref:restriction endonuclease subunit S n=1 Tax=Methylomonas sp. HW2-6 TaxID=3376687 RepID=UPI00404330AA
MKYPAYPQYKDSGVAWLGEVPAHWEVKKVKYLAKVKIGITYSPDDIADESDGVLVLRASNVQNGKLSFHDNVFVSNKINSDDFVRTGDILICSRNGSEHLVGKCAYIDSTNVGYTFGAFMSIVRSNIGLFLYYFFNSEVFKAQSGLFKTSTINQLTTSTLQNLMAALPSLPEQTSIANFLDSETGRIDTLVAKKRKLVALLKEKRSALISRTVTRGLPADVAREFGLTTGNAAVHEAPGQYYGRGDFNRPQAEANEFAPTSEPASSQSFKDSGVEWLGEIPANWATPPLYSRYSIELGKMLNESKITGKHLLPYLRNIDVQWDSINFIDLPEMDITEPEYSRYTLKEGDLLVCEGGEVGRSAIVGKLESKIGFQKALHRMRVINSLMEHPRYMYYLMYWANKTGVFNSGGISTIAHLTGEQLRKYRFPKPPFQEQTAIAAYLDRETAKIDRLVAKVETAIARLQEYRSALITAAVTGKIDVRAYSAKQETA